MWSEPAISLEKKNQKQLEKRVLHSAGVSGK